MALRVGIVTFAHLHVRSYLPLLLAHPRASVSGVYDHDAERGAQAAQAYGLEEFATYQALLDASDAVVVVSENRRHAAYVAEAARNGKAVLCEKPIGISEEDFAVLRQAAELVPVMTAFPCRFSPAYLRLKQRVRAGDIGEVRAICATNRGTCPHSWFVQPEESGGGAMIDHVVHVADLLRDLLGANAETAYAVTGNRMYGQEWEDTALVSLSYPGGVFATLDSSWSRPAGYRTWGDVTMTVVGDGGTLELDMFGQEVHRYGLGGEPHRVLGWTSNLDKGIIDEFVDAALARRQPSVTAEDGIQAAAVALAGYRSLATQAPVAV
jgi:predicted dehydrogenase